MQLLVSVIDAAEAAEAVAGGAAIIDVKDPREGALGAPAPATLRAVRAAVPEGHIVSAALGDLYDQPHTAALAAVGAALAGADLVKAGLRGVSTPEAAHGLLKAITDALAEFGGRTRLVACGYADARRLGSLPPEALPAVAAAAGCAGAMLDTFDKGRPGGTLLQALTPAALEAFTARCRAHHLLCGLAGSLRAADLGVVAAYGPDYAGVRGAACGGDRLGRVTRDRVRELNEALGAATSGAPGGVRDAG